jgi:hypothetical protein
MAGRVDRTLDPPAAEKASDAIAINDIARLRTWPIDL